MLQTIRDRATGWIAYVIVGLLVVPFALWGVNQYFSEPAPVDAAEVGGDKIPLREFQQAYLQQRARLQNMLGEQFDPDLFGEAGLKQRVLQQLVHERILSQTARQQGLRISDQQLQQAILAYDVFHEDGVFDAERYQRWLRAQGYSEVGFEEDLRASLATEQFQRGITGSAFVTAQQVDEYLKLLNQQREIEYLVLPLESYLAQTTVTDEAIEKYYQENTERFMDPEQVRLQYLELTTAQLAEDIPVDGAQLRALYEEQLDKYRQPEERSASHLLIRLPKDANADAIAQARNKAQEIHAAITAGTQTFQQALEEIQATEDPNVEAGELGVITAGMMEPAFESALFALEQVDDISQPTQTSFGFHIIRLDELTPEQVKSFADVKENVAREYRLSQAEGRFYDVAETLSNLVYEQPDSLAPAAETLGLEIQESPWFSRQGGEGIAAYPAVTAAAFRPEVLAERLNSEPLELEPGHVVVVRLLEHRTATPRSLEAVRDEISEQLRNQQAEVLAQTELDTLAERVRQGETLAALAEEFGAELKTPGLIGRSEADIDSAVRTEAFRLPRPADDKPTVGTATLPNGDRALLLVKRIEPGETTTAEAERTMLRQRLAEQAGMAEFQGLLDGLRQQTRVITYNDRL